MARLKASLHVEIEAPGARDDGHRPIMERLKAAVRKTRSTKEKEQEEAAVQEKPKKRKKGKDPFKIDNVDEEEAAQEAAKKGKDPACAYNGDDEEAMQEAQKKAKKMKDPFKIPPHAYNRDIFDTCQPFVNVLFSDKVSLTGEQDKVSDREEMDKKALKRAIEEMCAEYIISSRCSKSRSREMGFRDMHVSLAKAFWILTQPRSKQEVSRKVVLQSTQKKERVQGPEELEELEVVMDQGEEHTPGDSDAERPSTESLDVQFEGDEGETSGTKKSARFDINFRVIDSRVKGIDKSVVVLVVECKHGSLTLDDIYQVAAYTCILAKDNLAKGRYEPIYMEVWDDRSWRYGIFYPEGLVKIEDCRVKGVTKTSTSMHHLQGKLEDHVASLCTKYPNTRYPDGEYLEGILFISMQKFLLPNATMQGGGMTHHAKLFYQSKLRIIVGDRVLTWTEEDVERAQKRRREQVEAAVNAFLFE